MIPETIGIDLLNQAFYMFKRQNEADRQKFYINMSAFYFRIKPEMERVIKEEFNKKPFSDKTLNKMYWLHDDVIDKIISRKTAGVLANNPIILHKEEQDKELDNFLYSINFWETIKEAYKRSKYFTTILQMPVFDYEENKIRLDLLQGDTCSVNTKKDYLKMRELLIPRLDENQEIYYTFWSNETHKTMRPNGEKIPIPNNAGEVNPYKVIPASILRDSIGWDFWGEPNIALYTFQMLHTLKVSDNERGEFYYKFPLALAKNLKLGDQDEASPGYILKQENSNPDVQMSLEYIPTNTDWSAIRENESARREQFMVNQKIPASSASADIKVLSGYAKNIDEIELVETREGDKANLAKFIYDCLDKLLIVAKYNSNKMKDFKLSNIDIKNITLQFQELNSYESETDKWLRREKEKLYGMKDEIDFIMEDENCNEEEAIKILESKRKRRDTLKLEDKTVRPVTAQDLFNQGEETTTQPTPTE